LSTLPSDDRDVCNIAHGLVLVHFTGNRPEP
jgi:hypothetical protein